MGDFTKLVRLAMAIVISAALGACGSSSTSPAAPSTKAPTAASPAVPSGVSTGTSIDGTVVGLSGAQRYAVRPQNAVRAQATGPTISVVGTNISSPIDASGHFSLQGVPAGDLQLEVTGTGVNVTVTISGITEHEQVHVTIQVSGSSGAEADSDAETSDNRSEIEGKITAISGNTLTVARVVVTVPSGTPIQHGGTAVAFSDLRIGDRVHIHATRSGSTVTATSIELQTANPGNPGPPTMPPGQGGGNNSGETQVNGTVSSLGGTCPSLTFTVGATQIVTSSKTEFDHTTCATLANGQAVEVLGTKQSNGTLLASSVDAKGK